MNGETKIKGKSKQEWQDLYQRRRALWQHIHDYGAWEEMWADGVSLNMLRGELLEIQTVLFSYGESIEVPEEMPEGYMAGAERIRKEASASLKSYLESEDYRYLCKMESCLTDAQRKRTGIASALGAIRSLERAVQKDDLVIMREMGEAERFKRTLTEAAEQVRRYLLECKEKETTENTEDWQLEGQMSIYDLVA